MGAYSSSVLESSEATASPSQVTCGSADKPKAGNNGIPSKYNREFHVRFGRVAAPIFTVTPLLLQCVDNTEPGGSVDDTGSIDGDITPTPAQETPGVLEFEAPAVTVEAIDSDDWEVIHTHEGPGPKTRSASTSSTELSKESIETNVTDGTNISKDSKLAAELQAKLEELEQKHEAELAQKNQEIEQLKLNNSLHQSTLASLNAEKDEQIWDLHHELGIMKMHVQISQALFKSKSDDLEAVKHSLQFELATTENSFHNVQSDFEATTTELELTKQDLQREKLQREEEVYAKDQYIESMHRMIRDQHQKLEELSARVTCKDAWLDGLHTIIDDLHAEIARNKEEIKKVVTAADQVYTNLHIKLEAKDLEIKSLREQLEDSRASSDSGDIATKDEKTTGEKTTNNNIKDLKLLSSKLKDARTRYQQLHTKYLDETKHLNSIIDSVPEAKLEKIRRNPALCANGIALPKLQISQKRQMKEYSAGMIQLHLEQYPEFPRDYRDFGLKAEWLAQTHGSSLEERSWEGDDYFDCLAVTDDP